MTPKRQPTAPARADSSSKHVVTDGSDRIEGSAEERAGATKSAIRDIIRRYRETFERLAR